MVRPLTRFVLSNIHPHDSLILIADFDRIRWASVHSLAEIYVATCASCQIRGGDLGHPVGVLLSVEPELDWSSDQQLRVVPGQYDSVVEQTGRRLGRNFIRKSDACLQHATQLHHLQR